MGKEGKMTETDRRGKRKKIKGEIVCYLCALCNGFPVLGGADRGRRRLGGAGAGPPPPRGRRMSSGAPRGPSSPSGSELAQPCNKSINQ